jgi:hypothetical protein
MPTYPGEIWRHANPEPVRLSPVASGASEPAHQLWAEIGPRGTLAIVASFLQGQLFREAALDPNY